MSQHRIYISVCGEGLGHSSRALAVAEELINRGCEVFLGSYGYAYDYLKNQDLCKVLEIPKEWEMKGNMGKFDTRKTFFATLKILLTKYRTIINKEKKIMGRKRITCVISDGRIGSIMAGSYHLGLPVLFVTNIITIKRRFLRNKLIKYLLHPPLDWIGRAGVVLLDEIVVPDFPPPNTISYHLLSKRTRIKKKILFIGPLVNKSLYNSKTFKTKKKTVLTLVGGHEYRRPLIDCVSETARLNEDINFIVISRLIEKKKENENLKLLPFVEDIYSFIKSSDLVIAQAGHSTTMEMVCSGKTGILIPDKGQYEQEAIAKRVKELGVFETMSYSRLTPKTLTKKLGVLMSRDKHKKNVKKLSKLAKRLNGPKKVADMAINYSSRMTMKY